MMECLHKSLKAQQEGGKQKAKKAKALDKGDKEGKDNKAVAELDAAAAKAISICEDEKAKNTVRRCPWVCIS